ncbi:MAG: hypothetical protein L3J04_09360, partial [Robiginitomaculum sp.]|nr:hypothetical protein [Robiginitomaculum sp.]
MDWLSRMDWLSSPLLATVLVSALGFLFRKVLADFFTKSIKYQFDKKLEDAKAESRKNEVELEGIRSFLRS